MDNKKIEIKDNHLLNHNIIINNYNNKKIKIKNKIKIKKI